MYMNRLRLPHAELPEGVSAKPRAFNSTYHVCVYIYIYIYIMYAYIYIYNIHI